MCPARDSLSQNMAAREGHLGECISTSALLTFGTQSVFVLGGLPGTLYNVRSGPGHCQEHTPSTVTTKNVSRC